MTGASVDEALAPPFPTVLLMRRAARSAKMPLRAAGPCPPRSAENPP